MTGLLEQVQATVAEVVGEHRLGVPVTVDGVHVGCRCGVRHRECGLVDYPTNIDEQTHAAHVAERVIARLVEEYGLRVEHIDMPDCHSRLVTHWQGDR